MKPFQILLIISFLLTACAPRTTAATPPAQATVASTPSPTETPPVENTKIVPTPTERLKTIEELAATALATETFPPDLNPEQYSAVIAEMNLQRGPKPIYAEVVDGNGNKATMFYNTQTRKIETRTGSYDDNKAEIDELGSFNIYVEIGQNEEGLTTYVHPDTGEEMVVPNSGGMDWNWLGDKTNVDGVIDPTTLENEIVQLALKRGDSVKPVILIDQNPARLTAFQGRAFTYDCLEVIRIIDGVGIREFIGPEASLRLMNEGSSKEVAELGHRIISSEIRALQVGMVYYVFFDKDQAGNWENSIQKIDSLQNVSDAAEVYKETTAGYSTEGTIMLRAPIIVLRADK